MKRIAIVVSIVGVLAVAVLGLVAFQSRSDPIVVCVPTDGGTRPRSYCLLNPFRDRAAEIKAENLLEELKKGNTEALAPYLTDSDSSNRARYLTNEAKYRITSWRIGDIEVKGDELNIQYWVSRNNYPVSEEAASFFFLRTMGEWNLRSYSAIY